MTADPALESPPEYRKAHRDAHGGETDRPGGRPEHHHSPIAGVNTRRGKVSPFMLGGLALIGLGVGLYFEQKPAPVPAPGPAPTPAPVPSPTPAPATGRTYTVRGGDTLWAIAGDFYGNPYLYPQIYSANAAVIEQTAQAHGFATSGAGHWIFPGEVLVIP